MEVWKDISGYEGIYQVSNSGKIKSLSRLMHNQSSSWIREDIILKPRLHTGGYLRVNLHKIRGEHGIDAYIHRLVAEAFIPNPENKPHVNHLDGDKTNNNDWNLAWATESENANHALDIGLVDRYRNRGSGNGQAIIDEVQAKTIKSLKGQVKPKVIADYFRINSHIVYSIHCGKTWIHV